jgi:diguanylate cyclase (GGDEF)-like protein
MTKLGPRRHALAVLVVRGILATAVVFTVLSGTFELTTGRIVALIVVVILLTALCIAQTTLIMRGTVNFRRLMLVSLPFDVITLALLASVLDRLHDPLYVVFLGLAIMYSFEAGRGNALAVGGICVVGYLGGHVMVNHMYDWIDFSILIFNAAGLILLSLVVSALFERQRDRQADLELAQTDKVDVTDRLQRRLAELQAVTEITEVIHSDLDFDRVGPLMLDILQKVLNVSSASLMVIDKQKSETLFSASVGLASTVSYSPDVIVDSAKGTIKQGSSGHFSCITLVDHHHMMVVFCTEPEWVETFADEDRLVLQAVASELVVAVENSQLYKLTKRLSITDELTGLYNYRYLQTRLEEEFERAHRYRKDLSMLMIDVDDFKLLNDTHGHVAGDSALRDLGDLLTASVREVDIVARYGGEEFSVILPETDSSGAFVVAEKVREVVSQYAFADAEGVAGVRLTVSIGLASYPAHAHDRETLLREADDALYQAKTTGKNRVRAPQYRMPDKLPAPRLKENQ